MIVLYHAKTYKQIVKKEDAVFSAKKNDVSS